MYLHILFQCSTSCQSLFTHLQCRSLKHQVTDSSTKCTGTSGLYSRGSVCHSASQQVNEGIQNSHREPSLIHSCILLRAAAGHFGFEPRPLIDMIIFHYESNTVCNPPEQSHTRRVTQRQDQTCYSGSAQPAQTIRDTANISCSSQDVM